MANKSKRNTAAEHVADICLYGTHETGAGYIAATRDGSHFGNGEPRTGRTFTEAVWIAVGALEAAGGLEAGRVRVFAPGGERMAWMELTSPLTFSDLAWEAAPVYTISASELEAAASEVYQVNDGKIERLK
jgi:hypothetical protein